MKKNAVSKYLSLALVLAAAIWFLVKFGGPSLLRIYLESGIGSCKKIPILCLTPEGARIKPDVDKSYLADFIRYRYPKMEVMLPKGYFVAQETIKKVYYKKRKRLDSGSAIFLLRQDPDFFLNLFPQVRKRGVNSDYEFIRRTMYARLSNVKGLTDAFFVVIKSIFIPDLGNQNNVRMLEFKIEDKRGFINYNTSDPIYYFDCNLVNDRGAFFKIYIRDRQRAMNMDEVFTIISTLVDLY